MIDANEKGEGRQRFLLSNAFVFAVIFTFALAVFEYAFFLPKYPRAILLRHWEAADYLRLSIFCGLSLCSILLTLLFFGAAFSSRSGFRVLYFLIFAAVVLVEYGYYFAFGRFTTLVDLATAFFTGVDPLMAGEAVKRYFNWFAFIPVVAFGVALIVVKGARQKEVPRFALVVLAFVLFFVTSTYFTSNQFYAPSFSNFVRTAVSYPAGWYIGTIDGPPQGIVYAEPRASLTFAANSPAKNNIVFIVDESVRGDRLSINGHTNPTTPTLDAMARAGAIANWGVAVSGTTCSHTSNPLLLTGLTELPDKQFEVYRWPTIFQYARAAGYATHYFDGHTDSRWLGKAADVPDYGTWTKASDLGQIERYERDAEIARRIKAVVDGSTGNFIWVHKFGVHLRYENSFPNDRYGEVLDRLPADHDLTQAVDELRAIYDEALTYNLESFFATLLKDGPSADTVYIYTSDHGQSLREEGTVVSHCDESRNAANVPLLMIGSANIRPTVDTQFKASHSNIFATLLDLMNYPESERRFAYSTSLLRATRADTKPRFYYSEQLQFARRHEFD